MKRYIRIIITGMLMLFASGSYAAGLTYILDQSKKFEDGVDYLSVTLSDDNPSGQLSVSVEILPALAGLLGEDAGIEAFAFSVEETVMLGRDRSQHSNLWPRSLRGEWCNHIDHHGDNDKDAEHHGKGKHHGEGNHHGDTQALSYDDFDLPEGWKVRIGKPPGSIMEHDVLLYGSKKNAQDPLLFSVAGLTVDDVIGEFAVLVTGLLGEDERCEGGEHKKERKCGPRHMSALFYGGRLEPPVVVPVPPALLLMGSGLLGLVGVARRRKQSNETSF